MDESPSWHDEYPFESHYLEADGYRYHFLDEGEGDPVLMVHGNPTWSFYWRRLVLALSPRQRAIAVDHLGCGLSGVVVIFFLLLLCLVRCENTNACGVTST